MQNRDIDNGQEFDWGKASEDYALYRDIYPAAFYDKLLEENLCTKGQTVLDIGTGTGVLPRNLYPYGAHFVGIDIAENQIEQAKRLAKEQNQNIEFYCTPAESFGAAQNTFDVVTACQCFWYFDHKVLAPKIYQMLTKGGRLAVLSMEWLPYEDAIAAQSEQLVLKYNPNWSGAGVTRASCKPFIHSAYDAGFSVIKNLNFDVLLPFTRESWNGRIRACRGIGASLPVGLLEAFSREHLELLAAIAPEKFNILHCINMTILAVNK